MRSNAIESKKSRLVLSQQQRSIVVGTLLGDGHLETRDKGKTYRLKVEHSIGQKEYVDWLYERLTNLTGQGPKVKKRVPRNSYWFSTYSLSNFRFYGHQFYPNGKKLIPKMIRKMLTPLAIAVWFMDDGSYKSSAHKTFILHTLGYEKLDLELIRESLIQYGIKTSLHRQKDKWRVYVLSESAKRFEELVQPWIIDSMKYKLGNIEPKK